MGVPLRAGTTMSSLHIAVVSDDHFFCQGVLRVLGDDGAASISTHHGVLPQHVRCDPSAKPSREEILEAMNDNFCRCGAHTRVVAAIQSAAAAMRGGVKS